MQHKLNALYVKNIEAKSGHRLEVWDTELRRFGLRISPTGEKSWTILYYHNGRKRRFTIGSTEGYSLAEARTKAQQLFGEIADGKDPARDKSAHREEHTFGDFAKLYLDRHAKLHKRTWKRDEQMLSNYLEKWRLLRLSSISREDVASLHQRIGERHGKYAANRTLALLRKMFNLATDWGFIKGENPATRIKMFKEQARDRYLTEEEIGRLSDSLAAETDWRWKAYFPLSLWLGTRRSELLSARWKDIDLENGEWRIPNTKAGKPHRLALPARVLQAFSSLPSLGRSEWVFPSKESTTKHLVEPYKAWMRIRERAKIADARIHDLRHTLASFMVAEGYGLPIVGRALNHTQASTTQRYAHVAQGPLREALERTSRVLPISIEPFASTELPLEVGGAIALVGENGDSGD